MAHVGDISIIIDLLDLNYDFDIPVPQKDHEKMTCPERKGRRNFQLLLYNLNRSKTARFLERSFEKKSFFFKIWTVVEPTQLKRLTDQNLALWFPHNVLENFKDCKVSKRRDRRNEAVNIG